MVWCRGTQTLHLSPSMDDFIFHFTLYWLKKILHCGGWLLLAESCQLIQKVIGKRVKVVTNYFSEVWGPENCWHT